MLNTDVARRGRARFNLRHLGLVLTVLAGALGLLALPSTGGGVASADITPTDIGGVSGPGTLAGYCDEESPFADARFFSLGGNTADGDGQGMFTKDGLTVTWTEQVIDGEFILEVVSLTNADGDMIFFDRIIVWLGGNDPQGFALDPPDQSVDGVVVMGDTGQNITQFGFCAYVEPPTGGLDIAKTTDAGSATFEFTVECVDGDGSVVFSDSGTIDTSGTLSFSDIPAFTSCTVDETDSGAYTAAFSPNPAMIMPGETVTVDVINTRDLTSFDINKTAIGGDGTFTFDVTCTDPTGINFTANDITVTTTDGSGAATVTGVPTGSSCTVTEDGDEDWIIAVSPDGPIDVDTGDADFTNEAAKGNLDIVKTTDAGSATFEFTVECTDADGEIVFSDSGTVDTSGTLDFTDIPANSDCTVAETDTGLYTASLSPNPVSIEPGETATVNVTNTRDLTTLEIEKTAIGGDATFTFDVTCTDPTGIDLNLSDISITTTGGSGSATISDVPTGSSCTVTEDTLGGWVLTSGPAGRIDAGVETASFTNEKLIDVELSKFYDANRNGIQDPGEPGIPGWEIELGGTVWTTGADGAVTAQVLAGDYTAIEGQATSWINITPLTVDLTVAYDGPAASATFGNVCVGEGGGHTIGFWGNKNGQARISASDLAFLRTLRLRNADDSIFLPRTAAEFAVWLRNANAVNMDYMLSAQLSATVLNWLEGWVDPSALIYAPDVYGADEFGFVPAGYAMYGGLLLNGHADEQLQEVYKNALDGMNNNEVFLQSEPCGTPATFEF